jgi:PAS domain S-box-containing protein
MQPSSGSSRGYLWGGQRPQSLWLRYSGAVVFTLAAIFLRMALIPLTGTGAPFVLFFGSTLAAAFLLGQGPGLLSALLGAAAGAAFFMPAGVFAASQIFSQMSLFLLEAVLIAWIADGLNVSRALTARQARALQASEEHYRVLTEVSPQVTWEADTRGRLTYTNDYWHRYAGLSAVQSLHHGWLAAVAPTERSRVRAYMRLMFGRAQRFETEVALRCGKEGRSHWHLVRGRPVRNARGRVYKWVGVAMDIQAQKQTEEQLATAVRARDNFLSTASHELKTPLTSMQLMTQMMRRNWQRGRADAYSPEKLTRLFAQIDKSVRRLTHIIDDMLDVSRISSGKLRFEFLPTRTDELVRDVLERLAGQIEASGVRVRVRDEAPVIGLWDKLRLEQVLTNLLVNAMRYGEGAAIEIQTRQVGEGVQLCVRDYGPGVSAELRKIIFDQFARGTEVNPSGGLGLGLYLSRQIVERHGGSICCESPPGGGAAFVVHLPPRPHPQKSSD